MGGERRGVVSGDIRRYPPNALLRLTHTHTFKRRHVQSRWSTVGGRQGPHRHVFAVRATVRVHQPRRVPPRRDRTELARRRRVARTPAAAAAATSLPANRNAAGTAKRLARQLAAEQRP